jgi:hypothetical protein
MESKFMAGLAFSIEGAERKQVFQSFTVVGSSEGIRTHGGQNLYMGKFKVQMT